MEEVRRFTAKNGLEVTLREAVPDDACDIISTVKSTAPERSFVLMEQYGNSPEAERTFIGELDRWRNLLLVAVSGGRVIGNLAALQADAGHRPETSHILNVGLHIQEAFRGIGIGSEMLSYAVEWALGRGFEKMSASIFTTNKRSLHLFSKMGFVEECYRKKHIRIGKEYIDEVCVGKLLK